MPFIRGIIALCVAPSFRGRGIAGSLISKIESLARKHGIPFITLIAHDHRIYRKHGYGSLTTLVKWYAIEERESHSVIEENLADCFMYKAVGEHGWPQGDVDMLGYLF